MNGKQVVAAIALVVGCASGGGQQGTQVQLKIDSTNRTISVSADQRVSVDPELAILHVGFATSPSDAKTAYAVGAKTSNGVVAALKQAGIPEASIRSESQRLESVDSKAHKFRLVQSWTIKTPPERVAEVLDVAVGAGATDSGQIDWTVKDEKALEDQALLGAAARAKSDAAVLAAGIGVRLGSVVYATNQVSGSSSSVFAYANNGAYEKKDKLAAAPELAIEPRKVSRTATVYAVFAIE